MNRPLYLIVLVGLSGGCTTNSTSVANTDAQIPSLDTFIMTPDAEQIPLERCNDTDDDGDERIDEDFDVGQPCDAWVERCLINGTVECAPDGTQQCSALRHEITLERCNGIDDDCDGQVDETYEVNVRCSNAPGICGVPGRSQCSEDGLAVVCDAETLTATTEQCNGLDDDCDNAVDEDFAIGTPCNLGQGACLQSGFIQCDAGGSSSCDASVVQPEQEQCNEIDDDCDGVIDEWGCSNLVRSDCHATLVWRTDLQADPLPLALNQCNQLSNTDTDYACVTAESNDTFATIELPFRNDAVVLGYGFGIGLSCDGDLPAWLTELITRDCRIYFGFTSPTQPPLAQSPRLANCPQERFGYSDEFESGCASVAFGDGFGGIEFNRALQFGDQLGFALECRQTVNDPENARIRGHLNRELIIEMGWTKANTDFLNSPVTTWPGCEPDSPTLPRYTQCARSGPNTTFGRLTIQRPATANAPNSDVIGVRLFQNEDSTQ
jgi:hypothetical protein